MIDFVLHICVSERPFEGIFLSVSCQISMASSVLKNIAHKPCSVIMKNIFPVKGDKKQSSDSFFFLSFLLSFLSCSIMQVLELLVLLSLKSVCVPEQVVWAQTCAVEEGGYLGRRGPHLACQEIHILTLKWRTIENQMAKRDTWPLDTSPCQPHLWKITLETVPDSAHPEH